MEYHHPVRVFMRRLTGKRRALQRVLFRYLFRLVPVSSRRLGPPRGVCFDLSAYVAARQHLPESERPKLEGVHPASRLDYPPPLTLGGRPDPVRFNRPLAVDLPAAGLCLLPHARVYGRRLAVINAEDQVVEPLSREYGDDIRTHFVFSRPKLPPIRTLGGNTCFLACMSGNNYYHWLFDCLPILDIFERSHVDVRAADHLIFTGIQQPFQREMLEVLRLPLDRIVETDRIRHIEAERLTCASTQILCGGVPRWAVDYLRNSLARAFFPEGVKNKGRRLYLSRADAEYRRVRNGEAIEAVLQRHGFETVVLGKRSVREQIELFAGAEAVVGPHGAGLANLVFAPEGTAVIELFAPEYQNPCYHELSCTAGHRYRFLLGETEAPVGKQIPEMTRLDMTVSPGKLETLLSELAL